MQYVLTDKIIERKEVKNNRIKIYIKLICLLSAVFEKKFASTCMAE